MLRPVSKGMTRAMQTMPVAFDSLVTAHPSGLWITSSRTHRDDHELSAEVCYQPCGNGTQVSAPSTA